jgi:hypothetical protein
MVSIASIDLSEHKDLYNAIKETISRNQNPENSEEAEEAKELKNLIAQNFIFDNKSNTVWIQWYN